MLYRIPNRLRSLFRRRCTWCRRPIAQDAGVRGVQGWYCCAGHANFDDEASAW